MATRRSWLHATLITGFCLLSALALVVVLLPDLGPDRDEEQAELSAENPTLPTTMRLLTLDVAGSQPAARIAAAQRVIQAQGSDIVAFQGLRSGQASAFKAAVGQQYGMFPGLSTSGAPAGTASIAWRTDRWALAEGGLMSTVKAGGATIRRPWVVLRNTKTGKLIAMLNADHPADNGKDQTTWRNRATTHDLSRLGTLLGRGIPVLYAVGVNTPTAPGSYYCSVVAALALKNSQGGNAGPQNNKPCVRPQGLRQDQWYGTRDIAFSSVGTINNVESRNASLTKPVAATATFTPPRLSTFRVATFNLLGANHTDGKKPERKGWAKSPQRTEWAVQVIRNNKLDVVGFQEFQDKQRTVFKKLMGKSWALYPGDEMPGKYAQNSIGWRTADWELISKNTILIPYFKGELWKMPYVLLQNKRSGEQVWFANFHNPATNKRRGNHAQWRAKATQLQVGLANQLTADGTALIITGDMNDKAPHFCAMTSGAMMAAANGGSRGNGPCVLPPKPRIDWIYGSYDITFSGYADKRTKLISKTTDHPLIYADAAIAPTLPYPIRSRLTSIDLSGGKKDQRPKPVSELLPGVGSDLVAFRGMDRDQYAAVKGHLTGWATYPKNSEDAALTSVTIGWRTGAWKLVKGNKTNIPHRNGVAKSRAYVLLQHRATGRQVYLVNLQNPADTVTANATVSQQSARKAALAAGEALISQLAASGIPVWVVLGSGDTKNPGSAPCTLMKSLPLTGPIGGPAGPLAGKTCAPARDQGPVSVLATNGTTVANPTLLSSALAQRASRFSPLLTDFYVAPLEDPAQ